MPNPIHEIELHGGTLDGVSWAVPAGQAVLDVIPIDGRAVEESEPVEHRTHRYRLEPDGRYRYAGVVAKAKSK